MSTSFFAKFWNAHIKDCQNNFFIFFIENFKKSCEKFLIETGKIR